MDSSKQVFTVGHSTRAIEEFLEIMRAFKIEALVDVRSYPASRRNPQFSKENLSASVAQEGFDYYHFKELGGRRTARADSSNTALTNPGFRGYADYMETQPFRDGIERLLGLARLRRTAIMCAESLWWRCHRSLIADYLTVGGIQVTHILNANRSEPHSYTSAARVVEGRLSYRGLLS